MPRGRKRRYRNHELDSEFELDIIKFLYADKKALKRAFTFSHESEQLKYIIEGTYNPDFVVEREDGHKIYIEAKGYLDDNARRKMIAVRKCHPDKDIRFIFYSNNKIRKGARMRYLDWAEKNGFNHSIVGNRVPVEWLVPSVIDEGSTDVKQRL